MKINQKQLFLFAGIGLAVSGVVTMLLIYQGLSQGDMLALQQPLASQSGSSSNNEFRLEEVHSPSRLAMHDHVRLVLVRDNQQVQIPANIGISSELWKDHSLDEFGIGMAPMHTHDATGTIHIESTVEREFTLGQFLQIWGGIDESKIVRLTDINGNEIPDYANHFLKNGDVLVLEVME